MKKLSITLAFAFGVCLVAGPANAQAPSKLVAGIQAARASMAPAALAAALKSMKTPAFSEGIKGLDLGALKGFGGTQVIRPPGGGLTVVGPQGQISGVNRGGALTVGPHGNGWFAVPFSGVPSPKIRQ